MSSPSYPIYKTSMKMMEEDVWVMDALAESVPMPGRTRQPLEHFTSSSSTDICCSWEECEFCRFRSCCQFSFASSRFECGFAPSRLGYLFFSRSVTLVW
ncbi:hypothetical protein IEQ34_015268 [Dendrobium chrysotoxum]|uniref:Uncharacterized protein n=1 Tax=Dendrobium chrysotoxum TaxID=161865 RepID=A0AAV7GFF3_DENCH|nr:hypothetical protein IEQ34_015268 [Dendrobium chrysotoxum]